MELPLRKLSIEALDVGLKNLRRKENAALADILMYLSEFDQRKAYRELGFSSLFTYCSEALDYSEGAAYRRVQAARLCITNPEILDSIKTGKLTLCSIAEISKVKAKEDKINLLKTSAGKSKRVVQVLTAQFLPPEKTKKDSIRIKAVKIENMALLRSNAIDSQEKLKASIIKYNFSMEVDEEFMRLYKDAKELIGNLPASEIFSRSLKEYVEKRTVLKRNIKPSEPKNSRFIPKSTKLSILKRDNRQCSFVSKEGKCCTERHGLQIDHIEPYAFGGNNGADNLRLLCKAHNLLQAEKSFGKDKIQQFLFK
jgi:hypothetical protein